MSTTSTSTYPTLEPLPTTPQTQTQTETENTPTHTHHDVVKPDYPDPDLCTVNVKLEHLSYVAGQVVSGHVEVELGRPRNIVAIQLMLVGQEQTEWPAASQFGQMVGQKRDFLAHTPLIFPPSWVGLVSIPYMAPGAQPSSVSLDSGKHTFPFSVRLPVPLPWSVSVIQQVGQSIVRGNVKFDVCARLFVPNEAQQAPASIQAIPSNNVVIHVAEVFDKFEKAFPTSTSKELRIGNFFPSRIALSMALNSIAVHLGGEIIVTLKVENGMKSDCIGDVKIWLVQDTVFKAGNIGNTTQLTLAEYIVPESRIAPKTTFVKTLKLPVPVMPEMWGHDVGNAARVEWERRGGGKSRHRSNTGAGTPDAPEPHILDSMAPMPRVVAGTLPTTSLMGLTQITHRLVAEVMNVPSSGSGVGQRCAVQCHVKLCMPVALGPPPIRFELMPKILCYSCHSTLSVPSDIEIVRCGNCKELNSVKSDNVTATTANVKDSELVGRGRVVSISTGGPRAASLGPGAMAGESEMGSGARGVQIMCYACRHAMIVPAGYDKASCPYCSVQNAVPKAAASTTTPSASSNSNADTHTQPTPSTTTAPHAQIKSPQHTLTLKPPNEPIRAREAAPTSLSAAVSAIAGAIGGAGAVSGSRDARAGAGGGGVEVSSDGDELGYADTTPTPTPTTTSAVEIEMKPIVTSAHRMGMTRQASAADTSQLSTIDLDDIFVAPVYDEFEEDENDNLLGHTSGSGEGEGEKRSGWFSKGSQEKEKEEKKGKGERRALLA